MIAQRRRSHTLVRWAAGVVIWLSAGLSVSHAFYLNVTGTPSTVIGTPVPWGYGSNGNIAASTWITNSVATPVTVNTTNWGCNGWTLKTAPAGTAVTNGPGTQAVFQVTTTNLALTWVWTNFALVIKGSPANYGIPTPLGYGTTTNAAQITVTNAMTSPFTLNGTNWGCTGWALTKTTGGAVVTNDSTTQAVFTLSTNLTLTWYWARFSLVVTSTPTVYGKSFNPIVFDSPTPHPYGTSSNIAANSWVTNTVTSPFETNGARYAGNWTVQKTSDGSAVSNGAGPQATFLMSTNLTLIWNWTNTHNYLTATAGLYGNVSAVSGWYTNTSVVQIDATAADSCHFVAWIGDVPPGGINNNPLFVTMNQARTLQANFATNAAGPKTWTGTNNWTSATNWSPVGMPGPGDTAIIGTGTVALTDPVIVGELIVSNKAILVFSNWTTSVTATNVTILSGGTVTSAPAFLNNAMSNRVWFICTNFTVNSRGLINADGAGYSYANGPGAGGASAYGYGGGGYGGHGGLGRTAAAGGTYYGEAHAPMNPGSGGRAGGNGGGAVLIQATETATIFGTISANGLDMTVSGNSGGSGGSIFITCKVFAGSTNGLLKANGGTGATFDGGGGGGGRIALVYNSTAQAIVNPVNPGVRFSTARGGNSFSFNKVDPDRDCQDGTLYLPDSSFVTETIKDQLFNGVRLFVPDFTSWSPNSLTLTNCGVLTFAPGFQLFVTNQLLITSAGLGLDIPNGEMSCGRLVMPNAGTLRIYSGPTNAAAPDYGSLITVTGDVSIGTSSWIYPYSNPTNGGSALFRMNNLTIATNGGFNADTKGFIGDKGPGHGIYYFRNSSGAGYGGKGEVGVYTGVVNVAGGVSYGSSNAPVDPGSAGGGVALLGGVGGGLIRIQAKGSVSLNGMLTANGQISLQSAVALQSTGGGSGGGIFITCSGFSGNSSGLIQANGNGSYASSSGAAGGGGRIAVWSGVPQAKMDQYLISENVQGVVKGTTLAGYDGLISVAPGVGATNLPPGGAEAGTKLFFTWKPGGGMLILIR